MKRFATFTVLVLLTMLLLAGTAAAQPPFVQNTVYGVYNDATGWTPAILGGWANSNRSGELGVYGEVYLGFAPLIRNVPGQLTHTAFQLNTNSCASCHMTHTAIGTNLLIRSNTSDTCAACHDGTMGFLNVNAPATATTMGGSVAAGTFGANANRTASIHNVDDGVNLSGAPGGNNMAGTEQAGASWSTLFTCASCHAPHGSHSIRLLHANPNNVAVRAPGVTATLDEGVAAGRWTRAAATFNLDTFTEVGGVYTYALTLRDAIYASPWVLGYTGSATIAGVRTSNTWTRIYNGASFDPNSTNPDPATTMTTANLTSTLTRNFTINFATGQVMQTPAQRAATITQLTGQGATTATTLTIDVALGLRVRARAADIYQTNLVAGARQLDFINPVSYDAPAYNLFCAACHTDYLPTVSAGSQTGSGVGLYSEKFRHTINRGASTAVSPMPVRGNLPANMGAQRGLDVTIPAHNATGSNRLMCISCHFAHGADASMMLLANNTRVSAAGGAPGTPTDSAQNDVSATLGGSSALKRYINQASCWHCHVRSSATPFQNTDYFWTQFPQGPTW